MRILTASDVRAALPMRAAIDAMREAFIALSAGRATVPIRGALEIQEGSGLLLTMPSHVDNVAAVKVVSVFGANPLRGLPVVLASVLVLDGETGVPQAFMDGTALTAIRTGAASGLATDLLARPDAAVLGVIGAGVQARTQIEAVCAVRAIREVRVYCRTLERSKLLVDELQPYYQEYHGATLRAAGSTAEALDGADVVVTATGSLTPVIRQEHIRAGMHLNGIGSFTPQMQEIAAEVVEMAKVVVDHRASAWAEAGDLIIPRDQGRITEQHVCAEIGEVAAGQLPGRTSPDELTFFKSVGNAIQDIFAARYALLEAHERDLGTTIRLND